MIGDVAGLPPAPRSALQDTMGLTAHNTGMILNLALNYGGRQEIVRAVNNLLKDGAKRVSVEEVSGALDTAGLPDPDLLIRTSGEMRLSNFMLWQLAYTEFYITPKLWPDFKEKDLCEAIAAYQARERRFGGV
jgi:undecaprenyl diphosphate synthase